MKVSRSLFDLHLRSWSALVDLFSGRPPLRKWISSSFRSLFFFCWIFFVPHVLVGELVASSGSSPIAHLPGLPGGIDVVRGCYLPPSDSLSKKRDVYLLYSSGNPFFENREPVGRLFVEKYHIGLQTMAGRYLFLFPWDERIGQVSRLRIEGGERKVGWQMECFYEKGYTDLVEEGRKTRYSYLPEGEIYAVETHWIEGKKSQLYRRENYTWHRFPGVGEPLLVACWLEEKEGEILYAIDYQYDKEGRCITQTLYGSLSGDLYSGRIGISGEGRPVGVGESGECEHYSVFFRYDERGRLVERSEENGSRRCYEYSGDSSEVDVAPKITRSGFDPVRGEGVEEEVLPSFSTVSVEEKLGGGSAFVFDCMGRPRVRLDEMGNGQIFRYDSLGRLLSLSYPLVPDSEHRPVRPTIQWRYDVADRPIAVVDPCGGTTWYRYNSRSQLTEVLYPDGTRESYRYGLDGSLLLQVDRRGMRKRFIRDGLGRIMSVEEQDRLGKKVREWASDEGDVTREGVTFQLSSTDLCRVPGVALGRSSEEEKFDVMAPSRIPFLPDPLTEEEGVWETVMDPWGQRTRRCVVTSRGGKVRVYQYDALGRLQETMHYSSSGTIERTDHRTYDLKGQLLSIFSVDGRGEQLFGMNCHYSAGSLLRSVEIVGRSPTLYTYDSYAELSSVTKPDGVVIHYAYDDRALLVEQSSSDGTLHYRYGYDELGRVVSVEDLVRGETSSLQYDALGRLVREVEFHALPIEYSYDEGGRVGVLLPDQSSVVRHYRGSRLEEIERYDSRGWLRYRCRSDEEGGITTLSLPGELGVFEEKKDGLGRTLEIKAPEWCQKVFWHGEEGRVDSVETQTSDSFIIRHYSYDDLGRLVEEIGDDPKNYEYDPMGRGVIGGEVTRDGNGNLVKWREADGTLWELSYDALDRLVRVVVPGKAQVEFHYDGWGRRFEQRSSFWKEGGWSEPKILHFVHDGKEEMAVYDESRRSPWMRAVGDTSWKVIPMEVEGEPHCIFYDHLGDGARLLRVSDGKSVESYRYGGYGQEEIFGESGERLHRLQARNPWRWRGHWCEPVTGWVNFGSRHYSSSLRGWLREDVSSCLEEIFRYGPMRFPNHEGSEEGYRPVSPPGKEGIIEEKQRDTPAWRQFFCEAAAWWKESAARCDYWGNVEEEVDLAMEDLLGHGYLQLAGYYRERGGVGLFGHGECDGKVRLTFINGITNLRVDIEDSMKLISNVHLGNNVHYVFRATEGWTRDLCNGMATKIFGFSTPAQELANTWRRLIREMGGIGQGGLIIHYAHSMGGRETLAAAQLMTSEELRMIRVVTIGSATMIPKGDFESVVNYVSANDVVPLFADPVGYLDGLWKNGNVVFLESRKKSPPLGDHLLLDTTYSELLRVLGKRFVEFYGRPLIYR